jgi:hypothetical protein
MDDISPAARRMTYAELAEVRGEAAGLRAELDARRQWGEAPPNWWTPLLSSDGSGKGVEWVRDGVNSPTSSSEKPLRC